MVLASNLVANFPKIRQQSILEVADSERFPLDFANGMT
jgi:hypothetical protein